MRLHYAAFGLVCLASTSAFAWDPNAGADMPTQTYYRPVPAYKPAPVTPVYRPAPVAAPAVAAPAPVAYIPVPTYVPVVQTPAYVPPPPPPVAYAVPPVAPAPAYSDYTASNDEYYPSNHYRPNHFALGVEGFYDRYQEPGEDLQVDSRTVYGSVTGEWTHYYNPHLFTELDGRVSYGKEHYHSLSGTATGIDDWEYEARFLAGPDFSDNHNGHWKPYIGLGSRYYTDLGKGVITTDSSGNNFSGYDRRIFQLYMPVGLAYEFPALGLRWAPKIEVDPLLVGHVASRLGTIPGYSNAENEQHDGLGLRADLPFGMVNEQGYGWQLGPFIRYWNVQQSNVDVITTPSGPAGGVEPHNNRVQTGVELKVLF